MTEKKWEILSEWHKDIVTVLLKNRGIVSEKQKNEFFHPLHPAKITLKEFGISQSEIKKALARIELAKKEKQKVIIFGDYDCDGISATAILWQALNKYGANVMPFIPNRFSDGYGMRQSAIEKIKNDHPDTALIISVDNGIVAHSACEFAASIGIDVIITDHHEKADTLPKSVAIIHTTKTSGSGVAWILARELGNADELLPFATIGTVADQLPLLGVNRAIVKHGLEALRKTKCLGLLTLIKDADIDPKNIGTYEIGYIIAPRINAMGRMGDAMDSLRLLCTTNSTRANLLSKHMSKTNLERQRIVEEAVVHANELMSQSDAKMLTLLAHESYHEGIIGLAASRLVETYGKPAIVIAKGELYSKGSARSVVGLHITQILREVQDLLVEVGGHEMAAGFTVETANLVIFEEKLQAIVASKVTAEMLLKRLRIDMKLPFSELKWKLADDLKQFEPFGIGNPQPVFVSDEVEIKEFKAVGTDDKHAKLKVKADEVTMDAIAFGWGKSGLKVGQKISLAYNLETNIWQNVKSLQVKIKDIKPH